MHRRADLELREQKHRCDRHGNWMATEIFDPVLQKWTSESNCGECDEEIKAKKRRVVAKCDDHGEYEYEETLIPAIRGKSKWVGIGCCVECNELRLKKDAEHKEKMRRYELERRINDNTEAADIPPKFQDKTLESFEPPNKEAGRIQHTCIRYVASFDEQKKAGRCLLLLGKVGTGKTHLAMGIANALLAKGYTVRQTSVNKLALEVRATFGDGSIEHERDVIARYVRPDLLVLDEIGVGRGSAAEQLVLHDVLSGRYDRCLPTIITTNLDREALRSAIGYRLYSRLQENSGVALTFKWEDHRSKRNGEQKEGKKSG